MDPADYQKREAKAVSAIKKSIPAKLKQNSGALPPGALEQILTAAMILTHVNLGIAMH